MVQKSSHNKFLKYVELRDNNVFLALISELLRNLNVISP